MIKFEGEEQLWVRWDIKKKKREAESKRVKQEEGKSKCTNTLTWRKYVQQVNTEEQKA